MDNPRVFTAIRRLWPRPHQFGLIDRRPWLWGWKWFDVYFTASNTPQHDLGVAWGYRPVPGNPTAPQQLKFTNCMYTEGSTHYEWIVRECRFGEPGAEIMRVLKLPDITDIGQAFVEWPSEWGPRSGDVRLNSTGGFGDISYFEARHKQCTYYRRGWVGATAGGFGQAIRQGPRVEWYPRGWCPLVWKDWTDPISTTPGTGSYDCWKYFISPEELEERIDGFTESGLWYRPELLGAGIPEEFRFGYTE